MKSKKQTTKTAFGDHPIREKVAEISELPRDAVLGMPLLTVLGQSEFTLENYTGIIEYTDALLRIQVKGGRIRVTGKQFQVVYYANDEMKVKGCIHSIEYLSSEAR